MATKQAVARPVDVVGGYVKAPRFKRGLVFWVVGIVAGVALGVTLYLEGADDTEHVTVAPIIHTMTRDEVMRDLVNRGLIPAKSLEPARPTRDEIMRDLVNRGLIPAKSLEPRQLTRDEIMRDLVNRGLIPAQSLDD